MEGQCDGCRVGYEAHVQLVRSVGAGSEIVKPVVRRYQPNLFVVQWVLLWNLTWGTACACWHGED